MMAYEGTVRAETYPMYRETLRQVKRTVYGQAPLWLKKLGFRCLGADAELNRRYALLTVRALAATNWLPPAMLCQAAVRGLLRNTGYVLRRRPHPAIVPAEPP